jgi:hypothetical protein
MFDSLRKLFSGAKGAYHRRWPRLLMGEPVRVRLRSGEDRPAMLTQLSGGGARIQISQRLNPGEDVSVDFTIASGEHHLFAARVVHAVKEDRGFSWLCGIRFVGVAYEELERIAQFVEEEQHRRKIGFAMPRT